MKTSRNVNTCSVFSLPWRLFPLCFHPLPPLFLPVWRKRNKLKVNISSAEDPYEPTTSLRRPDEFSPTWQPLVLSYCSVRLRCIQSSLYHHFKSSFNHLGVTSQLLRLSDQRSISCCFCGFGYQLPPFRSHHLFIESTLNVTFWSHVPDVPPTFLIVLSLTLHAFCKSFNPAFYSDPAVG